MATVTDVLVTNVGGTALMVGNRYVQYKNNVSPFTTYNASAATDSNGRYSILNIPPGVYTINVSTDGVTYTATSTTSRIVPYTVGDDLAVRSVTVSSSPYTPSSGGAGTVVAPNLQGLIHPRNRIVGLGDSITTSNLVGTVGLQMPYSGTAFYGQSHNVMGQMATMGKVIFCGGFGAAGKTTTDLLSTYLPQVLALSPRPGACVVLIGTNDASGGMTTATFSTNIISIASQLRNVGIEPILCTVPPQNDGNATRDRLIREYNDFFQRFCSFNGMQLIDFFKLLVDPTTGQFRSGYSGDGTHLSSTGVVVAGNAYRSLNLQTFLPYLTSNDADAHNLIANGTFAGAGPVATSWSVATVGAGYTDSTIAGDPGIVGQWQQISGAAGATPNHDLFQVVSSGFSPGDVLAFSCLMSQFNTGNSGTTRYGSVLMNMNPGIIQQVTPITQVAADFGPGLIYIEVVVPALCTSINIYLRAFLQLTARFAQATLINLTTAGLTPMTLVAS